MGADPLPSLRRPDIRDAGVGRARRPKNCISVLEEGLQSGGGGGDAQESAGVRAPDPLHPDVADALPMEGPVDGRHDIVGLILVELDVLGVHQLETALVHCGLGPRWLLLGGLGGLLTLDYRPPSHRGGAAAAAANVFLGGDGGGGALPLDWALPLGWALPLDWALPLAYWSMCVKSNILTRWPIGGWYWRLPLA